MCKVNKLQYFNPRCTLGRQGEANRLLLLLVQVCEEGDRVGRGRSEAWTLCLSRLSLFIIRHIMTAHHLLDLASAAVYLLTGDAECGCGSGRGWSCPHCVLTRPRAGEH